MDREQAKKDNFRRLMNARVTKLCDQFDSVENTTNPASYSWTKEQATAIMTEIEAKVASLRTRLGEGSDALKVNGKATRVVREII